MATWRYATPEECVEFAALPDPPSEPEIKDWDILPILEGSVRSRSGDVLSVPAGKSAKLLRGDGGEPWVYSTLEMTVLLGGKATTLRPGTAVAIFSTDWKNSSSRNETPDSVSPKT